MKATPLRTLAVFAVDNPDELERQLSQFEQNVDDAIRSTTAAALPLFQPTNRKVSTYSASLDELVRVDTSAGDVSVVLPVATPKNAGRCVAIARMSASNVLTAGPVSGQVNGTASLTLTAAVRLFVLISDGAAWWSTA